MKKSHSKSMNEKNEEIRNLKTAVAVLEESVWMESEAKQKFADEVEIQKLEMDRVKNMNDLRSCKE